MATLDINLRVRGFTQGNKEIQSVTASLDALSARISRLDKQMSAGQTTFRRYHGNFRSLLPVLGQFSAAMWGIDSVIKVVAKSFNTNLKMDALEYSMKVVAGNTTRFEVTMDSLRKTTDRLGLDFVTTAEAFKQWDAAVKESNLTVDQSRSIFESVANAGAKLKLSNEQVRGTFLALSQMLSKGVVSMEELRRQMGDRIPGTFQLAAKAMNMTEAELNKLVSSGKLASDEFLPRFAKELDRAFGNNQAEKVESLQASVNRLSNAMDMLFRSERATAFFKTVTDGLTDMVTNFDKALNSKSFQEFFTRINPVLPGAAGAALADAQRVANEFKKLTPVQQAVYGYAQKETEERKKLLAIQKQGLDLRVQEYKANPTQENKERLKYFNDVYAEMIKINSELGMYDNKVKSVSTETKKVKENTKGLSDLYETLAKQGDFFEQKINKILLDYNKLVKSISTSGGPKSDISTALGIAKAQKDMDVLLTRFDRLFFATRGLGTSLKTTTGSLLSTPGPITSEQQRWFHATRGPGPIDFSTDGEKALEKRLGKVVERGLRRGIDDIFNDINNLGSNFYEVFTSVFQKIAATVTNTFGQVLSTELGNLLAGRINAKDFSIAGLTNSQSKALVAGGGLLGGILMGQGAKRANMGLSIGGGVLSGAAAGMAFGPWGAAIGAVIGGIAGIFSGASAKKQQELSEAQLEEQKKQTALLERQNALAITSSIIGTQTNQGIVTGVDRNAFGEIEFTIEGRKLKAVLDRENAALARGL